MGHKLSLLIVAIFLTCLIQGCSSLTKKQESSGQVSSSPGAQSTNTAEAGNVPAVTPSVSEKMPATESVVRDTAGTLTPAESKARSAQVTKEAAANLDEGKEASAKDLLTNALQLNPDNRKAKQLFDDLTTDPKAEWGGIFFEHTLKKGETLGKVAQCYLGDPIRFYALARYNAIAVPRTIPAGTKLKIPTAFKAKVKRCK